MSVKNENILKAPASFEYTELRAVEEFFEKQEAMGWQLHGVDRSSFVFHKAEPRKIRYQAVVFNSELEEKPSYSSEFVQMCANEGWEYVAFLSGGRYIFRSQRQDITEIMTDDEYKYKSVVRKVSKDITLALFWSVLIVLQNALKFTDTSFYVAIKMNESEPVPVIFVLVTVYVLLWWIIFAFDKGLWLIKNRSRVKNGERVTSYDLGFVKKKRRITDAVAVLSVLALIGIYSYVDSGYLLHGSSMDKIILFFLLVMFVGVPFIAFFPRGAQSEFIFFGKKKEILKRSIAVALSVLMFLGVFAYNRTRQDVKIYEEAPVTVDDLGFADPETYKEITVSATGIAQQYRCYVSTAQQHLMYELFVGEWEWLTDRYVKKVLKNIDESASTDMIELNGTPWDICYVSVREGDNSLGLAVKDGKAVYVIYPSDKGAAEFLNIAYTKLFPAE